MKSIGRENITLHFRRRVRDEVKGFQVASGGKGRGKGQPSTGKPNHFVHVIF